jgi:hypothetical protein
MRVARSGSDLLCSYLRVARRSGRASAIEADCNRVKQGRGVRLPLQEPVRCRRDPSRNDPVASEQPDTGNCGLEDLSPVRVGGIGSELVQSVLARLKHVRLTYECLGRAFQVRVIE